MVQHTLCLCKTFRWGRYVDIPHRASIDEHSILWVDTLPHLNEDGSTDTPYDYIVRRVARSLNGVSIAIGKVDVK